MFTIIVQIWLVLFLSTASLFALQSAYLWLRDGREVRRQRAAHFYANLVVMDRVHNGELASPQDIRTAYEFEKIAYLNR